MPGGFDYGYVEIYKDFFKKVKLTDGSEVYSTQRSHSNYQEFNATKDSNTKRIFIIGSSVALLYASYGRDL